MSVTINNLVEGQPLPEELSARLMELARLLLKEHRLDHGEVGIILAGDGYLQQLNRNYRGLDKPTDVLAFGMIEPENLPQASREQGEVLVGDVYISLERAREQALEAGHHLHREILILAAHGILHLLGFDHADEAGREKMQKKEAEILGLVD
jgi:probable rRNA maturation factor